MSNNFNIAQCLSCHQYLLTKTSNTTEVSQTAEKRQVTKKTIAIGVTGQVVWFNVCKGYGFTHRDDQNSNIFRTGLLNVFEKFSRSFQKFLQVFESTHFWVYFQFKAKL